MSRKAITTSTLACALFANKTMKTFSTDGNEILGRGKPKKAHTPFTILPCEAKLFNSNFHFSARFTPQAIFAFVATPSLKF